jgi:hypothetical protein
MALLPEIIYIFRLRNQRQIKGKYRILTVMIPTILMLIGLFSITLPHFVYADPAHCDKPGYPSCYSVGFGDGQQNQDAACPPYHSTHFCDGWHVATTTPAQASPSQPVGASQTPSPALHPQVVSQTPSPAPPSTGTSVLGPINDLELLFFLVVVAIIGVIVWKLKHRGGKDRQRRYFSDLIKENILDKQHHKCAHCNRLLNVVDYDHKNGDRSNNKESNCIALCPNCHAIKTRRTR